MTAFTISDDATSSGGGLSANAMALGADTNLVFNMRAAGLPTSGTTLGATWFGTDGVLAVNRKFKLTKAAAALKAKVATSHLSTNVSSSIDGTMKVIRGSDAVATFPFTIPPAGQIPAPTGSAEIVANASSTVRRDVTKIKKFTASRKDASGSTPIGDAGSVWLGKGSTRVGTIFADLTYDEIGNWGNDLTTGPDAEIVVIPYDQLANKEGGEIPIRLSWPLGPFTKGDSNQTLYSIVSTSGNLPEGTVVNFLAVYKMPTGAYILAGIPQSFTITAAGGLKFNPGGYIDMGLTAPKGSYGMPSRISAPLIWLYKLSTHTRWNETPWGNGDNTIANTFAEGAIATPPSSFTFSAINSADVYFNIGGGPIDGTSVTANNRVQFKVFSDGKLVAGPGSSYNSALGQRCYWSVYNDPSNDYLSFDSLKINVNDNDYQPGWPAYGTGTVSGDAYYTDNQPVGVTVNIPARLNVTNLDIYVQEFTTVNGHTTVENNVPFKLIYSGPYVASFQWTGAILNSNPTVPVTNTTANYPAVYSGNLTWDAADPAEVVVLEGDQVVCELTAGSLNPKCLVQLSIPVEFID